MPLVFDLIGLAVICVIFAPAFVQVAARIRAGLGIFRLMDRDFN